MSVALGTLAIVSGTKTTFAAPNNGVKAIVIGNESGLTVTITMESGGVQKTLYPSVVDWFPVHSGFSGNILVNPVTLLSNSATYPASSLIFDAIGLNDHENASMYPIALPRNVSVGNTLPLSGSTTSIQNDGNAANTSIVEATQSAAVGSNVSMDNSGNLTIKEGTATLITLLQLIAGASTGVKLGASTRDTQVLGDLFLNTGMIGVSVSGDVVDANTANAVYFKARTSGTINFQTPNGTTRVSITTSGLSFNGTGITWKTGDTVSGTHGFTGSGTGTYTHGAGGTPFIVLPVDTQGSSSMTVGIDTITATQVNITCGAAHSFKALTLLS